MSFKIMSDVQLTKQTISYSDGSETVVNYSKTGEAEQIEKESAEMVEENNKQPEVVVVPKVEELDEELELD